MPVLDQPSSSRKLAAILSADIAGYSALMSADEEGAVRKLREVREAVLPIIEKFGGRIIDLAGDGILAEFPSKALLWPQRAIDESSFAPRLVLTSASGRPPRHRGTQNCVSSAENRFPRRRPFCWGLLDARLEERSARLAAMGNALLEVWSKHICSPYSQGYVVNQRGSGS